ncbi:MAG: PspC domain-containing protein [Candidatus Pacearchaeota archaeon]
MVKKKLYRSKKEKVFGGVCGGIGEFFDTDPTIIRLIWVLATLLTGIFMGIITYAIAWIIIPEKETKR